jgi:protein O-mannosyl-transferase
MTAATENNSPPSRKFLGFPLPDLGLAVLLALAVLVLYWPVTHAAFIYLDDTQYVEKNSFVQQGLSLGSIVWALTNPIISNWHPLTMWSYMLDYEFFGLNPGGFHFTNILLHAADTALVFLVFYRLTGARGRSWLVAALFGLHPLHVESVAWIAERKDVLSAFFWLLAMWTYLRHAECAAAQDSRAKKFYAFTLAFFVLGLMSKSMVVTLPCVFLLLDFWPLKRLETVPLRRLVLEKIPFFAIAAAVSVLTFLLQKQGGAMMFVEDISFAVRLQNALVSYLRYLGKIFWPENLAIFYPHPQHWQLWPVVLSALFLLAVSAAVLWRRRSQPFLFTGWFWFLGTLVPVIGLVQVGGQAMADRYSYIPSLGFFLLAVWGGHELLKNFRWGLPLGVFLSAAAVVFCCGKTSGQLPFWRDTETLSRHALAVTQENYMAHDMLGCWLGEKNRVAEAVPELQSAIRLKPDFTDAHYNLGVALAAQSRLADAIAEYRETVRLKPDFAGAHYNLGRALFDHGQIAEAMAEYREAARLQPAMQAGLDQFCGLLELNNLAWRLATSPDPAQRDGNRAVEIAGELCAKTQSRLTIFVGTLAAAYAGAGRFDEAVDTAQKACDLAAAYGDENLLKKNRELLALYQAHQPYRDPAAK